MTDAPVKSPAALRRPLVLFLIFWLAGLAAVMIVGRLSSTLTLFIETDRTGEILVVWEDEGKVWRGRPNRRLVVHPGRTRYTIGLPSAAGLASLRVLHHQGAAPKAIKSARLTQIGRSGVGLVQVRPGQSSSGDAFWAARVEAGRFSPGRALAHYGPLLLLPALIAALFLAKVRPTPLSGQALAPAALAAVGALAAVSVFLSPFDAHPDSKHHLNAAHFYRTHTLPPMACDPGALYTYSNYGSSYVNAYDPVYWLAGKFSRLCSPRPTTPQGAQVSLRAFNLVLFGLLLVAALKSDRPEAFLPLLITPQVWYVFGYLNGDAFPLFLSFIAAWQLSGEKRLLRRFLAEDGRRYWAGGLLAVGLAAGLLLSKPNFYPFLLGAGLYTALLFWFQERRPGFLKKTALIAAAALCILGLRAGWDQARYNGEKKAALTECAERLAEPAYKPSNYGREDGFPRLHLRDRGASLGYLFTDLHWGRSTAESAFGVYGYLAYRSGPAYYEVMFLLAAVFLFTPLAWAFTSGNAFDRAAAAAIVGASILVVGLSLYHSWVNDFQAQGRYLFPILPLLVLILPRGEAARRILAATGAVMFILAVYSFIESGLANVLYM